MNRDGNADNRPYNGLIKVVAETESDAFAAGALAEQLQLPVGDIVNDASPIHCTPVAPAEAIVDASAAANEFWHLLVSADQRTLIRPDGARMNIDFTQGKSAARQAQPSKDQSLVRALGLHKLTLAQREKLHVVDATAGLGQDGWIIACQGCKTTLLEQSPIIAAMLQHAIHQAALIPALFNIANQIDVKNIRSQDFFANYDANFNANSDEPTSPDIIYLDPMFPHKKKQAKVKKGMQFLQALLPDNDNKDLLKHALATATSRVVVKRPSGADVIEGTENWSGQQTCVKTDATRFDIYHTAALR